MARRWLVMAGAASGLVLAFALLALVFYQRTERAVVESHTQDHERLTRFAALALQQRVESRLHRLELLAAGLKRLPPRRWESELAAKASLPGEESVLLLRSDGALWLSNQSLNEEELRRGIARWQGAPTSVLTNPFPATGHGRQVALLAPLEDGAQVGMVLPFTSLMAEPVPDARPDSIGARASQLNLALVDEHGEVLFNSRHPEMIGRRIPPEGRACQPCHSDFNLERKMLAGESGRGWLEVGQEPLALVTFTPD